LPFKNITTKLIPGEMVEYPAKFYINVGILSTGKNAG
jgi:hypothetical protein